MSTGWKGRRADGSLSYCPKHSLPVGSQASGMSGNTGHWGEGRADTLLPRPRFLLGTDQDLENHRGKSQGSEARLVPLRTTLIKVQCGPVPSQREAGEASTWVPASQEQEEPGSGPRWPVPWEGSHNVLETAQAQGADALPGHVNLGKLLNFSKSPFHHL